MTMLFKMIGHVFPVRELCALAPPPFATVRRHSSLPLRSDNGLPAQRRHAVAGCHDRVAHAGAQRSASVQRTSRSRAIALQVPVKSGRGLSTSLLLCDTLLDFTDAAKRYLPDLVAFLARFAAVSAGVADDAKAGLPLQLPFAANIWQQLGSKPLDAAAVPHLNARWALLPDDDAVFGTVNFRAATLCAASRLLQRVASAYSLSPSCPEICSTLLDVAERAVARLPPAQKSLIAAWNKAVEALRQAGAAAVASRRPMIQRIKPKAITTYNPKFREDFAPGKDFDPDRERAENRKLTRKLKREKKGAVRELRRDTSFLAQKTLQERLRQDELRNTKRKQASANLEKEAMDGNVGIRAKSRKKRRK
jgi:nucleolar protein 14